MHDEDIEKVLKSAGAREKPPVEIERAVRDSLRAEWRAIVAEKRRHTRRRTGFALAAGVLAAATAVWIAAPRFAGPGETIGTMSFAAGDVRVKTGFFGGWNPVSAGNPLRAGESMETGSSGRGALALAGGVSARLDSGTRLTLASTDEIVLDRGAIYIDAGSAAAAASRLDVITPTGSVRHVGTQYEVRLIGSGVRLRVREGRVEWQSKSGGVERSESGEQLTIAGDGSVDRQSTPRYGATWDWIAAATPGIEIEGLPLSDFLDWAARELGREVRFDRTETAREAADIVLHGSISGLTPSEALDAVLVTTRLRAVVADGEIRVQGSAATPESG